MRNKISCSAKKLSQLEPDMVKSVVGGHVYKLGNQYHAENRVRLVETNESQVNSEVAGTYGMYSQQIRLKGGSLTTKCSCPASEQPFCRHCVAVLLAYFHTCAPEEPEVVQEIASNETEIEPAQVEQSVEEAAEVEDVSSSSPVELKFHEVTIFIEWVQGTVLALKTGGTLPQLPSPEAGKVRTWAEVLQDLNDRYQESEKKRQQAEGQVQDGHKQIGSLTQAIETVKEEAKESQVTCATLRQELDDSREMIEKFSEITKERDGYVDQLNDMRGELLRKGAELDSLAASLKQVSAALQAVTPPPR